jgi:hypothetical protein
MSDEIRRVHRARLRTGDAALVAPGRALLEDALHVATVPGAQGSRLTLIRRLELGAIDVARSSASLALRIEARMRDAVAHAVPGESDAAARSDAVYFVDPVHPMVALALRIAQGAAADEWFWRDAVPGWRPGSPQPAALREIVLALAQREEALPALARLIEALLERGVADVLLRALRPEDGPLLMRALRAPVASPSGARATQARAPMVPAPQRAWLARAVQTWGPDDGRCLCLGATLLSTQRGSGWAGWEAARALLHAVVSACDDLTVAPSDEVKASASRHDDPHGLVSRLAEGRREPHASAPGREPVPTASVDHARHQTRTPAGFPTRPEAPRSAARIDAARGLPTRVGGLLFVLPALERLGMSAWLAARGDPEDGCPLELLHGLACDLGAGKEDGMLAALPPAPRGLVHRGEFVAPAHWLDGIAARGPLRIHAARGGRRVAVDASQRLVLASWAGCAPPPVSAMCAACGVLRSPARAEQRADPVRAWRTALRRWLRRYAGVGLASLVRRPATVEASATHLDVHFDLEAADVRIRCAGLDLDPGWVPWLGRVVSFHYRYDA